MYGVIAAMSAWAGLSVAADDVAPVCNCPKTYLGASGGYVKNGDFEGAFGSGRLGRVFCKSATRAMSVELEFNGLYTDANSSVFYPEWVEVMGGSGNQMVANVFAKRIVKLREYAPFINLRYMGHLDGCMRAVSWMAGVGVGADIVRVDDTLYGHKEEITLIPPSTVESPLTAHKSYTRIYAAGQCFAGVACQLTDWLRLTAGGRLMAVERQCYGGNKIATKPVLTGPAVKTDTIRWMAEIGVVVSF